MEGRKPVALWLELEQQLPTWLSSEGGEEWKRRSSRDGVVYANGSAAGVEDRCWSRQ